MEMNWRILASAFAVIFLAELGDKTQLAAMAMAAESKSPLAVLAGAVLALALVTLMGVVIGGTLSKFIPATYIRKAAGVVFILVGAFILVSRGS